MKYSNKSIEEIWFKINNLDDSFSVDGLQVWKSLGREPLIYLQNLIELGTQIVEEENAPKFNYNSANSIINDYYIITKIIKKYGWEKNF